MKDIITVIRQAVEQTQREHMVIAIDGRCAAGKTSLAAELQKVLDCNVIHMDHFFLQPQQRTKQRLRQPGGNVDHERFLQEVAAPLQKGVPFAYRVFDCKKMDFSTEIPVDPGRLTIVEGAYSCHPALWDLYDLRIFLTVDPQEQLRRISHRNGEAALTMFREKWIPLEEMYFSAYHIKERCDHVFTCGGEKDCQ